MTSNETITRVHAEPATPAVTGEATDWLQGLAKQRHFLRFTTRDLTDEQAGLRTTASELCLGGLIKHVTRVERSWVTFIQHGPSAMPDFTAMTQADWAERAATFRMLSGETLAGVLADYTKAAHDTDTVVASLPDLDVSWPLPKAPWNEPGTSWSIRRVLIHLIAETAQHCGHADIIRESLDGAQSMA
ncbi:DinB family protein [Streptomyces sp. NPDC057694]|uniref:DinB family protein n=1 Tax=Streptomyces sp. NPDC057694 TaxID=3346216 RepID=UPI0036A37501